MPCSNCRGCDFKKSHLGVFNWAEGIPIPAQKGVLYEVRFKATRKQFYQTLTADSYKVGDWVMVETKEKKGYDIGQISMPPSLAKLRAQKQNIVPTDLLGILRHATEKEVEQLQQLRAKEEQILFQARTIVQELELDRQEQFKLSDVEYQADGQKAIFYFTAPARVDFRQLVRQLNQTFRIQSEMRQISPREEGGLIGGIGSCGRELCCSRFLRSFPTVNTKALRYQGLGLNPERFTGLCGRLKCCLNYELDVYLELLKKFPQVDRIYSQKTQAQFIRQEIFQGRMWFLEEETHQWLCFSPQAVQALIDLNQKGQKPESWDEYLLH
ncbi:MAG: PSP1 domain-containing protein [Bacteroidia bacterium]